MPTSAAPGSLVPSPLWDVTGGGVTRVGKAGTLAATLVAAGLTWGAMTGAPAVDRQVNCVLGSRYWTSAGTAALPTRPFEADVAVRSLKARTGLSWQELADVFGVSRRALHLWANGGNLSSRHQERLGELIEVVDRLGPLSSADTRSALTTPDAGGTSVLGRLVATARPRQRGQRSSLVSQLDARPDGTYFPADTVEGESLDLPLKEF
jgi:hypothetical protein